MDRDDFVTILWKNILSGQEDNFEKHVDDGADFGPYDMNSIMHYFATAFGRTDSRGRTLTTIQPRDPSRSLGGGLTLSRLDIQGINRLYPAVNCGATPVLFEDVNFRRGFVAQYSSPNLAQFNLNDKISSICVPVGWTVHVFRDKDYRGGSPLTVVGPGLLPDLRRAPDGRNWNDTITAVRVEGVAANPTPDECNASSVLFEHDHYNGRRLVLDRDYPSLKASSYKFNDIGSSLCVSAGVRVSLFEDSDYRGDFVQLVGPINVPDLHRESPDGKNWGDKFSSVKIDR